MPNWLRNIQNLAASATIATAVIALAALLVAIIQINASNDTQREATAQNIYSEYLKLAIEHPHLANGISEASLAKNTQADYEWFVSYVLHSTEHIYLTFPNNTEWQTTIAAQACLHKAILSTAAYQKILKSHYDPNFGKFVNGALTECEAR